MNRGFVIMSVITAKEIHDVEMSNTNSKTICENDHRYIN